jgi:hypothetical protein
MPNGRQPVSALRIRRRTRPFEGHSQNWAKLAKDGRAVLAVAKGGDNWDNAALNILRRIPRKNPQAHGFSAQGAAD